MIEASARALNCVRLCCGDSLVMTTRKRKGSAPRARLAAGASTAVNRGRKVLKQLLPHQSTTWTVFLTWIETCCMFVVSLFTFITATLWLICRVCQALFCMCRRNSISRMSPTSVLITGASAGIGKGLALEYAKKGARLVLIARRLAELKKVEKECLQAGARKVTVCPCDVRERVKMHNIILACDDEEPLDLIVANAGVLCDSDGISGSERVLDINLRGALNTVFPICSRLMYRQEGQILFVSSLGAYAPATNAFMMPYLASKAAINQFGAGLRAVMAEHNVGVSVACLGMIESDLTVKQLQSNYKISLMGFMPSKEACPLIVEGIEENRAAIVFPLWLYLVTRVLGGLSGTMTDAIAKELREGDPFSKIDQKHPLQVQPSGVLR